MISQTRFPRIAFWRPCLLLWALIAITALFPAGVFSQEPLPPDLATRQAGEDWPQFLGPRGNSTSSEQGLRWNWNSSPPKLVWQTEVGESYGICSISRGRCFQLERLGDEAALVCRHSETGEQLWSYKFPTSYEDLYGYNNGPRCSPVVDGDRVYLYGVDGQLHCVSISTKSKVWSVDTAKKFGVIQNFFGVGSSPVIEGDLLLCVVGGSPPEAKQIAPGALDQVTGNGSGIVAFDKYTGEVTYQLSHELAGYSGVQLASLGDRRWAFAFLRGGLLAFEPTRGKLDFFYPWRSDKLESVNASMPVVWENRVFISETYGPGSSLLEFSPGDYRVVWADRSDRRQRAMQTHWNTAVYVDGYLYGSSGRHTQNAELRCIKAETGEVQWSEPDLSRCSLLAVDGKLVCLGEYGKLTVLKINPEKFDPVAEFEPQNPVTRTNLLQYPAWAAPIVSHGYLYVRGRNHLFCYDLQ
jgi:outer membrane protein assembly factor BamB